MSLLKNKKGQIETIGAIVVAVIGALTGKPFLIFLGIILALIFIVGTSAFTGIPLWMFGLAIFFIFLIINWGGKRR